MSRRPPAPPGKTQQPVQGVLSSAGWMTDEDISSAHPDDRAVLQAFAAHGPVILGRAEIAPRVGYVYPPDVDHNDFDAMQPYYQEAVRLMESDEFDFVMICIGGEE